MEKPNHKIFELHPLSTFHLSIHLHTQHLKLHIISEKYIINCYVIYILISDVSLLSNGENTSCFNIFFFIFVEIVTQEEDKNEFDYQKMLELLRGSDQDFPYLPPGGGLYAK